MNSSTKANRIIHAVDTNADLEIIKHYRYVYGWHFFEWDGEMEEFYLELDPAVNDGSPEDFNIKLIIVADLSDADLMMLKLRGSYKTIIKPEYLSAVLKHIFFNIPTE